MYSKKKISALTLVGLWVALAAATPTTPTVGSFAELLDLRSASRLKPWRTMQASGYDRSGGFYDSGHFLRVETGPRFVLMESDGPGCIDRMWFTYKKKIGEEPYELAIYLDEHREPAIRVNLDDLFRGKHPPFVEPLAGLCGGADQPARYSYVPIGFERYCRVELIPTAPLEQYNYRDTEEGKRIPHIYYQITYRVCPPNIPVRPFRWDLSEDETNRLEAVRDLWRKAGQSPWGDAGDLRREPVDLTVPPDQRIVLFAVKGPGVLHELHLQTDSPEGLDLEIWWDGAVSPAVEAPVGPFFACLDPTVPDRHVLSLWFGCIDGRYYSYFPMPFREDARIAVRSSRQTTATLNAEIAWSDEPPLPDDAHFRAHRYDHNLEPDGEDYTVLDVVGRGHFVGLVMDHPGQMEGDDEFYVDGESIPSIHGTGTEDFFSFAWGLSHVASLPLHGITREPSGSPTCYRAHLPAAVPFDDALQIVWEHGHFLDGESKGPNLHAGRYSGVAFYYLQKPERQKQTREKPTQAAQAERE